MSAAIVRDSSASECCLAHAARTVANPHCYCISRTFCRVLMQVNSVSAVSYCCLTLVVPKNAARSKTD